MTTFDFVPSNVAPFEFSPILDGATYNCVVTWNVSGRRYYVSCYDLAGERVFSVPLIGSPGGVTLQSLSWDSGVATAIALDPHGYPVGSTVRITISGATPAGYLGTFDALVVDEDAFAFALAADPGPTVEPGAAFQIGRAHV